MSRIGRQPIELPQGVSVKIAEASVEVQGPKGKLTAPIPAGTRLQQEKGRVVVRPTAATEGVGEKELLERLSNQEKANWGLARALVANAVTGVSQGYSKELAIVGLGYKAEVKGKSVVFSLGYSHPVEFPLPAGIEVTVEKLTKLKVSGIDKQLVGQVAADMRALRPPDPYKQKGVRLVGELLRKKAGKAAATAAK